MRRFGALLKTLSKRQVNFLKTNKMHYGGERRTGKNNLKKLLLPKKKQLLPKKIQIAPHHKALQK